MPNRRLLLVDDAVEIRLIGAVSLARLQGWTVESVDGGQAALAVMRQNPPDLVLLDLELPDLPGREVLAALRDDPTTRDIPVVLLTAGDPAGLRRLPGVVGHLSKPFDPLTLADHLAPYLSSLFDPGR